jgi:hypothetical protein
VLESVTPPLMFSSAISFWGEGTRVEERRRDGRLGKGGAALRVLEDSLDPELAGCGLPRSCGVPPRLEGNRGYPQTAPAISSLGQPTGEGLRNLHGQHDTEDERRDDGEGDGHALTRRRHQAFRAHTSTRSGSS